MKNEVSTKNVQLLTLVAFMKRLGYYAVCRGVNPNHPSYFRTIEKSPIGEDNMSFENAVWLYNNSNEVDEDLEVQIYIRLGKAEDKYFTVCVPTEVIKEANKRKGMLYLKLNYDKRKKEVICQSNKVVLSLDFVEDILTVTLQGSEDFLQKDTAWKQAIEEIN